MELAVYTDAAGEERLRRVFPQATARDVPDDWPDRWRRFHRGVRAGALWVGPPWQAAPAGTVAVVVDPGRAFGTGAHPTTRLCLELLYGLPRGSLVDVGCGSGVLAVAAARLGFAPVVALDNDPAAVEATRANAARNGVEVEVLLADALAGVPPAGVAVANLTAEALPLVPFRSPAVVASGYLVGERVALPGYVPVGRRTRGGWAAEHFRRL